MLYNEFLEGAKCRDNAHNHRIYKMLEIAYMSDESITKEEVYTWGAKLAYNGLSETEEAFVAKCKEDIEYLKEQNRQYKLDIERYESYLKYDTSYSCWFDEYKKMIKSLQHGIKENNKEIRRLRAEINGIKSGKHVVWSAK